MTYPLIGLAGCTALIGLICLIAGPFWGTSEWFAHHLHATLGFELLKGAEHGFDWLTAVVGTIAALSGVGLSYWMYAEPSPIPGQLSGRLKPLYVASLNKFHVDELYEWLIAKPTRGMAILCEFLDVYVVERLVVGVAKLPAIFGRGVSGAVPERPDPVLRGGLRAQPGGLVVDFPVSLILDARRQSRRGLMDGDTPSDHGFASRGSEPRAGCDTAARRPHSEVDRDFDHAGDSGIEPGPARRIRFHDGGTSVRVSDRATGTTA